MADWVIDEEILRRLQEIAEREHRPVNEVLRSMVEKYPEMPSTIQGKMKYPDWLPRTENSPDYDPIEDFIGMFDDDVTDLSMRATGSMSEYHVKKDDNLD